MIFPRRTDKYIKISICKNTYDEKNRILESFEYFDKDKPKSKRVYQYESQD